MTLNHSRLPEQAHRNSRQFFQALVRGLVSAIVNIRHRPVALAAFQTHSYIPPTTNFFVFDFFNPPQFPTKLAQWQGIAIDPVKRLMKRIRPRNSQSANRFKNQMKDKGLIGASSKFHTYFLIIPYLK